MRWIDLSGQSFGLWQVLRYLGESRWECQCACGTIATHRTGTLRIGHTKSCGHCNGHDGKGPKRTIPLAGERFFRLVVLEQAPARRGGKAHWKCACDCGAVVVVSSRHLRVGHTKSCGCWNRDVNRVKGVKHLAVGTPEYRAWSAMHTRCTNTRLRGYRNYGGRGITVCERWQSFENFLADMGLKPSPKHSIDRINNDGNYEPGNCRWATKKQQARNTRQNRRLEHNHVSLTVVEWGERTGIPAATIIGRLNLGWPVARALTTNVRSSAPASAGHPAADPADPQPVPPPSPGVA